jgi:hypothetical protein
VTVKPTCSTPRFPRGLPTWSLSLRRFNQVNHYPCQFTAGLTGEAEIDALICYQEEDKFYSLQAQRESCEVFISTQRGPSWATQVVTVLVPFQPRLIITPCQFTTGLTGEAKLYEEGDKSPLTLNCIWLKSRPSLICL